MDLESAGMDFAHDDHYHDASTHGLAWEFINQLLHVIVFVFTLIGVINFRVNFITAHRLVRLISRCTVAFNWYLSIKFFLITIIMWFYNYALERQSIDISSLNCTLAGYTRLLPAAASNHSIATNMSVPVVGYLVNEATAKFDSLTGPAILPHLTWAVDTFGGPYKYIGNMATLIYGVFAIAYYIMLAIFPLELIYFVDVGFNFIRFVLSDASCMKEYYGRLRTHVGQVADWKRFRSNSEQPPVTEIVINQYRLRGGFGPDQIAQQFLALPPPPPQQQQQQRPHAASDLKAGPSRDDTAPVAGPSRVDIDLEAGPSLTVNYNRPGMEVAASKLSNRVGKLALVAGNLEESRLCAMLNRLLKPSYAVVVAHRNLGRFKPFVRSEEWFKASMIIYPIFIFFYFVMHLIATAAIQVYLDRQLANAVRDCKLHLGDEHTVRDFERWSYYDYIVYWEHIYSVLVLSVASSFYCSYFFSAILELAVWASEILQQLRLSKRVIEVTRSLIVDPGTYDVPLTPYELRQLFSRSVPSYIDFYVNDFGGFKEVWPAWKARRSVKDFKEPGRFLLFNMMTAKLLTRKETIIRAAYVNMRLFFDELEETRFITTTILSRMTQIVAGFAFMAAITQSQFKTNYLNLNILLISTFVIFNIYLACAATINSLVNKINFYSHSLICAQVDTNSDDVDMLDFFIRHTKARADEDHASAYTIYGNKITWSAIIRIDTILFTIFTATRLK